MLFPVLLCLKATTGGEVPQLDYISSDLIGLLAWNERPAFLGTAH